MKQTFEVTVDSGVGLNEDLVESSIIRWTQNLGILVNRIQVTETTKRCHDMTHYGPFLSDSGGKSLCSNCGMPIITVRVIDMDRLNREKK